MTTMRQSTACGLRGAGRILLLCIVHVLHAVAAEPRVVRLPIAEGKDIRFTHLSTEEGLSQSRVDHILQDAQGFLWIGTYNGLNRYDGYRFEHYKPEASNPNSIGGVFIYALFQDRSGALWIAVDQGLDRFDPGTGRFLHFRSNPGDPTSLAGHVEHITQDSDGMLWLATRNGLDRLDPGSGRFTHFRSDPHDPQSLSSNDVRFVLQDRQGVLWVATAAGPDAFDPRTGKVTRHYPSSQQTPLDRIFEDRSGTLWLSATRGGGLTSLDRKTGQFTTYIFFDEWPGTPGMRGCSAILEDRRGMLWLATKPDGVVRFDRTRQLFTRYRNDPGNPASLNNNDALSLVEDREGGIWVGTDGGGVNRFPSEPSPFTTYRRELGNPNSLDQDYVLSVFEDSQGTLWIGTKQLNRLDRKTGRYTFYRHDPANSGSIAANGVSATVEDRAGFLWFGTWGGGLNRFDRKTGRFKAYRHDPANPASLSHDYIRSLLLDHEGNVWAGTEDGLNRLDMRTGRFTVFGFDGPLDNRIYRVLAEDADGSIWMGTYEQGLQRLDVPTGKIVAYKHDPKVRSSLSNNRVNALCVDHAGTLWVGTQNGLNRFDRNTGEFTIFNEHDGLPNNAVEGILEDAAGNLWVSTGNGLSKFDPRARTVKNYFTDDGLPSDEFNDFSVYFRSARGEMFFGGVKGVTAFFPDRVTDRPFVPPVVLTEFRLFGEPIQIGGGSPLRRSISLTDSLSLSHRQNIFSVEFSSLSYASPLRNRYRYKLEGLDKDWNDADSNHRFATYTTLPPGDYALRVQGSSNRGVWNDQGGSLRIRILPPWWGTWWFRIAAGIVVLASVWIGYTLRVRSVQKRNRELVKLNLELQQSQRALQESGEVQRRLNRELRAISNCNQALIRALDERTLLKEICRIICEDAEYRMTWVGFAEHDEAKTLLPVAWAGIEDEYLATAGLRWDDTEAGRGPAGTAIRTGEPVYEQDLAMSPSFARWRKGALKRGYRSMIALPLKDESSAVFGVLAIYSSDVDAFTPEEIRLLEELAGDLAFGIMVLRARIERNEAEESLHQSQENYRAFFEQNLAGNYISTREGALLACNPAFLRMFGFASEAEAKKVNVGSLYTSPENRDAFLQQLQQQGNLEFFEQELRRKDGSPLFVAANAIGSFNEHGELVEVHGFLMDQTERRKTEQELRQAQKMEAVGRLSGGIAHDFNNIMAVIIGHSQLLLDQPEIGVSARRRVREILDSSHRAANLTRQLLAFSRKQVLQPIPLNLNRVIEGIDKMIRRLIGDDIEVRTLLAADLENVNADPGQMEQVIINFCVNARDAMPEGGRVTIETLNVEVDEFLAGHHFPMQPGRYVRLAVSDTGIGMSEQTLSQIFEPFFTTKEPEKGTGLGLAMVYGIVKQSGGHVWAYSEPGHGSTFSVYLPTVIEEAESCEPTSEPLDIKRGSETILLVEDAPSLRALIRELLEGFGYTVLEAEDAAQAQQIADQHKDIALLLTDISLPKTSGIVMAKSLLEKRPGLKVLYMSAHSTGVVDCKVQQAGADFLQKPFTQEALAQKLRSLLDSDIVNDPTA